MTPKPEGTRWTDEQWRAITEKGHDILVAAAAGSGKTAVLVERIIRRIMDPGHPVNIDELLVVTFTKAAASEMRERIGQALEKELSAHPENLFLRRQQALLSKAPIMTLHAFCMSIIKKYYYFLDLDPGFRLLDETEAELLKEEVLEQVLEENYASGDPEFFRLVDRYSGDRSDDALLNLVFRLYHFARSNPWPDDWLNQMVRAYHPDQEASIDDFSWIKDLKESLFRRIKGFVAALSEAREICGEPGGPAVYEETLSLDLNGLERVLHTQGKSWEEIRSEVLALSFGKMKASRGHDVAATLKDQVKKIRDHVKKEVSDLKDQWFSRSSEEALRDLKDMAPSVEQLGKLVKQFAAAFKKEKRRKGVLDFSDLEHEALTVLRKEGSAPGHEAPSVVATQYRSHFEEVLIDEYQDTNRVQESIIRLITRDGKHGGNLFMVGDVKQSIYGFRLAEPALFIEKYKNFAGSDTDGEKIDLSSNFRSRPEIINGTNFIFRQTMDEAVGDIAYDQAAELKYGADYPEAGRAVDLELIERDAEGERAADNGVEEYENEELEAAAIADRILAMTGNGTGPAFRVCDKKTGQMRLVRFRDIAILMRSASQTATAMKEVLDARGIPAYAELSTGYFDANEVSVMLSVLQVIDNPFQDIPLASVLRSPIVGLDGDALAQIRITDRSGNFFSALKKYVAEAKGSLRDQLNAFLEQLSEWKNMSVSHSVSELIWQIYRDTGFYDYAGGLTGGTQRQANLKAFYDRARQYEKTSFRGLFRFLRFIERLRKNGGDLGEARALSEQEDVVRIMTIHKSKGLEFPVVFVAGINKKFNRRDTLAPALLHKSLGFGTRWIDPDQRISVPTLPYLAIKEQMKKEANAEEMRILYVALTRAREKLILTGAVRNLEKTVQHWAGAIKTRDWLLPEYYRSTASAFLDWLGPCILRHRSAVPLHDLAQVRPDRDFVSRDPSVWHVQLIPSSAVVREQEKPERDQTRMEKVRHFRPVPSASGREDEVSRRLEWVYPWQQAATSMAKQTVTEIKSQQDYFSAGQDNRLLSGRFSVTAGDRPRFLQSGGLSASERGTALHLLMQHLNLAGPLDIRQLRVQGEQLVEKEILTPEQENSLDYQAVSAFFRTSAGRKMQQAEKVSRECPFSLVLPAGEVYPTWRGDPADEAVLIQGVIDCIIETAEGLILLDYKTDRLTGRFPDESEAMKELKRRYHVQLDLYRLAIEKIWHRPVSRIGLYAFDIGKFVDLTGERRIFK